MATDSLTRAEMEDLLAEGMHRALAAVRKEGDAGLQRAIDIEARSSASQAIAMIGSHERLCEERSRNAEFARGTMNAKLDGLDDKLSKTKSSMYEKIDGVEGKLDALYKMTAGGTIVLLLGIVGYLIDRLTS